MTSRSSLFYRIADACNGIRNTAVRLFGRICRKTPARADICPVLRKQAARRDALRKLHRNAQDEASAKP